MSPALRATLDDELWGVRAPAFAPGEFVGQESFVTASEVRSLAGHAGVGPGTSLLDVCCGAGGAGLFVTRELGCTYVGVDSSPGAIARARQRAAEDGLGCAFSVGRVPPLPPGRFDVVLLLETMLAFRDRTTLLRGVTSALPVGGRFAFTVEEGWPLTPVERDLMPGSDTVWLTPMSDLLADLERVGLRVCWHAEWSGAHRATVDALVAAYAAYSVHAAAEPDIVAVSDRQVAEELGSSHRLWSQWLRDGRVRKFAVVAEKVTS